MRFSAATMNLSEAEESAMASVTPQERVLGDLLLQDCKNFRQ